MCWWNWWSPQQPDTEPVAAPPPPPQSQRVAAADTGGGNDTDTMIEDFLAKMGELVAEMSTVEWIVAAVIIGLLVLGIVKQVAKIALGAVALAVLGMFLLNAQANDWALSF